MATAARTTTTYPVDTTAVNNYRSSYVDPLRARFVSGTKISSSDINLLRSAYVEFAGHTHDSIDYRSIGEYGNNGPRTVVAANPRTSSAIPSQSVTSVSGGSKVQASDINTHISAINAVRDHTHPIDDDS